MTDSSPSKDLFDLMQKMWNPMSFSFPGLLTPTISPDDLEKKISELKTVENWLTMNLGLLQMTIKAMEMQKSAIEALTPDDKGKGRSKT